MGVDQWMYKPRQDIEVDTGQLFIEAFNRLASSTPTIQDCVDVYLYASNDSFNGSPKSKEKFRKWADTFRDIMINTPEDGYNDVVLSMSSALAPYGQVNMVNDLYGIYWHEHADVIWLNKLVGGLARQCFSPDLPEDEFENFEKSVIFSYHIPPGVTKKFLSPMAVRGHQQYWASSGDPTEG